MSDFISILCILFGVFLLVNNIVVPSIICDTPSGNENDVNVIIRKMCKFIVSMYENRNLFGIFMTSVYLLISIPAFLIMILVQLIIYLCVFVKSIYNLGYKRK